ncbi:MAG: DUF937 domain-containing protein [Bacteroidales bacterium]|jgi:uncharacterized protein YidB (DUF937 family)|nr:DUF937 domain-containing protein [Bacteroidales bacterium]
MIDNLVKLVGDVAGSAISDNSEVPNEKNEVAIQSAAEGVFDGLKDYAAGGGIPQIVNMLAGDNANQGISGSLVNNVQSSVVSSLMEKAGIKNAVAQRIAGQLVPTVLGALTKNANAPSNTSNTGFSIDSLLSSITGGKTDGISVSSLLDKFVGNGDGKFDLNDIAGLFSKKSSDKQGDSDGGGLLGALGGLLGGK